MMAVLPLLPLLLPLLLLGAQAQHDWTYSDGSLDEKHWANAYPSCGGHRQSPINLRRKNVHFNASLTALDLQGYDTQGGKFPIINNGHTVQITLPHTMRMTAPDGVQYIAQQMHFHWGGASSEMSGSEHTVDGMRYMAEIHIVHYNAKYGSVEEAQDKDDGFAVVSILVEEDKNSAENTYYSKLINHLKQIRYPGQSTVLEGLDILDMLPEDVQHYYHYRGSLTTPPCTENVHWFLLADRVKLSKAQILKLENTLLDHHNETLHNDYRSTQPLHNRLVEANFYHEPVSRYHDRLLRVLAEHEACVPVKPSKAKKRSRRHRS